jgi:hypothetical protein
MLARPGRFPQCHNGARNRGRGQPIQREVSCGIVLLNGGGTKASPGPRKRGEAAIGHHHGQLLRKRWTHDRDVEVILARGNRRRQNGINLRQRDV